MAKQAFLINAPKRKRAARKVSRRKSASRKGVPAWVRAKGYTSWGAYMASIRPNKGGKVAKRRKRRASPRRPVARARTRRRRSYRRNLPAVYAANPVRRRRRRATYRSNPPSFNLKAMPGMVINAGKNAVGVILGKAGARIGRAKLGMAPGTPVGIVTEIGVGIAGGVLLRGVSPRLGENFVTGSMVSVLEALAKGMAIPFVSSALGDEDTLNLISGMGDDVNEYLNAGVSGYEQADLSGYELQEA